jgi:NCAIR mutase (PurE)-related protein
MNRHPLTKWLKSATAGRIRVAEAAETLRHLSVEDIEYAPIDHHRFLRKGFPEAIFGREKSAGRTAGTRQRICRQESGAPATRGNVEKAAGVLTPSPDAHHHPEARMTGC